MASKYYPLHPDPTLPHNPQDYLCDRRCYEEPWDDKAKCCTCRNLHECGYKEDTFACRVRHVNVAPMESSSNISRWERAAGKHGNHFGRDAGGNQ